MKLVFIHGAGSSSLSSYYQLRHFRNSKALDLPGHPNGKPCVSIDGYLEWVRGFITARRYKDVILCGHSMGGAIAIQHALKYPDEIRGLILIGTGAKLRVHPDYLEQCRNPGTNNSEWLQHQESYFTGVESDIHRVLMQRAQEIGPQVELNDLLACDSFDAMSKVETIGLPTLILCGDQDEMTPIKYADYLSEKIRDSQKYVIDGAQHFAQLQNYRQVNARIEEFVNSIK